MILSKIITLNLFSVLLVLLAISLKLLYWYHSWLLDVKVVFYAHVFFFPFSYTASGHLKGRIAADVAAALLMRLNSDQRREDEMLMKMNVWNQPEIKPVTDKEQVNQ